MTDENFEANKKAVEDICKEPANSECADCGANGTRWATVNHGQFVCIRCSGIHRSLGTHISKVKSTNLDKWTEAEVAVMRMIGNKLGRQLFEARLPAREKPSESDSDNVVKEFIVKKYDEKKYAAPDWVPALKKVFKSSGYKAGKQQLKDAAEKADAVAAAVGSDKKDKKSKKDKSAGAAADGVVGGSSSKSSAKVVGFFGTVNVAADQHDERLATVLSHFGIVVPVAVTAGEEEKQQQNDEEAVVAESNDNEEQQPQETEGNNTAGEGETTTEQTDE